MVFVSSKDSAFTTKNAANLVVQLKKESYDSDHDDSSHEVRPLLRAPVKNAPKKHGHAQQ